MIRQEQEQDQGSQEQCNTFSSSNNNNNNQTNVPTASQFIVPPDQFLQLPPELRNVDFTQRISWRKFAPYTDQQLPFDHVHAEATFSNANSPALCFHVNAISGRARATTLHLPSNRAVPTPIHQIMVMIMFIMVIRREVEATRRMDHHHHQYNNNINNHQQHHHHQQQQEKNQVKECSYDLKIPSHIRIILVQT